MKPGERVRERWAFGRDLSLADLERARVLHTRFESMTTQAFEYLSRSKFRVTRLWTLNERARTFIDPRGMRVRYGNAGVAFVGRGRARQVLLRADKEKPR